MRGVSEFRRAFEATFGFDGCDASGDDKPPRPGLPLILPLALSLWAVCAASYTALGSLDAVCAQTSALAGAVGSIALAVRLARASHPRVVSVVLGCMLGLCCAGCGAVGLLREASLVECGAQTWVFELVEDASSGDFGSTALACAESEEGATARVRLMFADEVSLLHGARIEATAKLAAPSESNRAYLWSRGSCAVARIGSFSVVEQTGAVAAIRSARACAIEQLGAHGGSQAGLLQALACGYRNAIEDEGAYESYKTTGLAHLVAVSGAHLAIVCAMVGWVLKALRVPHGARLALQSALLLTYLVMAGVPVSAVRAAAMVLLSFSASLARRRNASANALALCLVVFVALDPTSSVSVSLLLSAGSTLGIILFAPLVASWFAGFPRPLRALVAEPAGLTLASSVATQPVSAALFSQVPLIAPVANIVAAPLFSLACVAALAASVLSCLAPAEAALFVSAAAALVAPLDATVGFLSSVSYACVAVDVPEVPMIALSAATCTALWAAWPTFSVRGLAAGSAVAAAALAAVLVVVPLFRADEIVMLDVGQGDALLVRSGGASVLIDTGNQDARLRSALGRQGVYALDALFVTHGDDDHCGSMGALAGVVAVDQVLLAADAQTCACKPCESLRASAEAAAGEQSVAYLEAGDTVRVGNFTLEVVWPHSFVDEGGNADSLCLLTTLDVDRDGEVDWTALFCGDAEADQVERVVEEQGLCARGGVDVLKVGHHGARVSLTDELARALSPRVALISCGANNRYGHPNEETLERLESVDARIFRTDQSGDVKLTFTKDAMQVS